MQRSEYNPCGQNGTTPRYVIPRERKRVEESSQVADFILCWFFSNVVDSSTPLRCGRNDMRFFIVRYKFKCTTIPAPRAGWR